MMPSASYKSSSIFAFTIRVTRAVLIKIAMNARVMILSFSFVTFGERSHTVIIDRNTLMTKFNTIIPNAVAKVNPLSQALSVIKSEQKSLISLFVNKSSRLWRLHQQ